MPENLGEKLEFAEVQERDRLLPSEVIAAILLTTAAIFATFTSWTSALIDVELVDFEGTVALVNREQNVIEAELASFRNYTIYTQYDLYDTTARAFDEFITDAEDPAQAELAFDQTNIERLAVRNRFFFTGEFLTETGDYDRQREVDTRMAQAERVEAIDPTPAFEQADQNRADIRVYDLVLIVLGVSLSLYAISEVFHPSRRLVRYTLISIGLLLFLSGMATALSLRFGFGMFGA